MIKLSRLMNFEITCLTRAKTTIIAVYKLQIFMPQILKEKFHHFHHNLCPNYKIIVNKILQESKGIHFQNFILQEYAELIL